MMIAPGLVGGRILVANRQAQSPATWTADLAYNNTTYPVTRLAVQDGSRYVAAPINVGAARQLLATLDFGSSIFVQDVQVQNIYGLDYFGSGNTVGVRISVDDDTGTVATPEVKLVGQSTSLWTVNRASRYLKIYGQQTSGYGSNPAGSYTTWCEIDCLSVTGEP